ncbi:MAG: hypothetical protein ACOC3X_04025, partial [Nanoarchaeota archaeon]
MVLKIKKYDEKKFLDCVNYYKKKLGIVKSKNFLLIFDLENEKAFFSTAALSMALDELGANLHVMCFNNDSFILESMINSWKIYKQFKNKSKNKGVLALSNFLKSVEKKLKTKEIEHLFKAPDYILRCNKDGFYGSFNLEYKINWIKKRKPKLLLNTADNIWNNVYNLKKNENISIGFLLIPNKKILGNKLFDYLDSYFICYKMANSALNITNNISMQAFSQKKSMLDKMEKINDFKSLLIGCELSKNINEDIFKKFKELSKFIKTSKIKFSSANFFISGKGYPGSHSFGQKIGYPTPNKKSRWQNPAGIIYKPSYAPQTKFETRPPKARVGFTETLPIEIFIETCNVNWDEIKAKNDFLKKIAIKCEKIIVESKVKSNKKYLTNFEVGLIKKDGKRREVKGSDVEIRNLINKNFFKKTKIKAGTMANLPGGEMFLTPEFVTGLIVGDVVINIDESYPLNKKKPLVISSTKKKYKIIDGPKKIIEKINTKKKQAWNLIKKQEKFKSLPKKIIDIKKKNFNLIGEFAVNTNPKAKLCDYLIVNEKIAGMIHVAIGSGFEEDRATEYHSDIVIDAKAQKLDIYG